MLCSNCGIENRDGSDFCMNCGMSLVQQPRQSQQTQAQTEQQTNRNTYQNGQNYTNNCGYGEGYVHSNAYVDPYNHTAEFDREDVSQNKVFAMLPYLLGWIGLIVALIASRDSKFVGFHVRQALKISVSKTLLGIIALLLCWTVVVPIAAGIMYLILWIVRIISFFSVCSGNAIEAPIVRSFGFLK